MNMDINIGSKIRELRKNANLSIKELAKRADVSTGLVSQIERNLVAPSVTVLYRIAQVLSVNVGYFFGEETIKKVNPVVRKNERKRIHVGESNGIYELLTPDANQDIEFLYITLKSGQLSSDELITHEGVECGFVLKGHLLVKVGNEEYYLGEGDSITFDSSIPHRYINVGDRECISIWAMTPPTF